MATTDQQSQLLDAMARAKQIAAKLAQQSNQNPEESRKRFLEDDDRNEPMKKMAFVPSGSAGGSESGDAKSIAQQVANSLVQRAGFGSMLVEEVMIPNKLVGLVIGRGGEMINKLQSESGAKIQVAADPPQDVASFQNERQITITGVLENVDKAKALIDEIRNEGKVPDRLLGNSGPGEYSTEVLIPSSKVGLVIGKGGETIKSLQERAGCKMVLFQDGEYQNAPEKPIRISGERSKVEYGEQLVSDLITQKELEAMGQDKFDIQKPQNGNIYEEYQVPREAVGFVIGTKGSSINNIQQQSGCKVQFKNEMEGEFKIAMLNGTPAQVEDAKSKIVECIQMHQDRKNGGGSQGGFGNRGGNWQGGNNRPGWNNNRHRPLPPGHKHMLVDVPAGKCGLIIGKGGETLRFIHQDTKAFIEIERNTPNDAPVRQFHLKGTEESIDRALDEMRDKINDNSIFARPFVPQGNGGGWNGGPSSGPGQAQGGWGNNQGWNQNQQWGQQGGWGQQQQQQQWGQGGWNQQQGGWNQQPANPQQQQWGQQYQQWGQPATQSQVTASTDSAASATTAAAAVPTTDPATGQPDYSAAWALYYQQQQQYYQYNQSTGATTSTSTTSTTAAATGGDQSQSMADYQKKLAEYYKQYGSQQPEAGQPEK